MKRLAATIGVFDGVHRGHLAILRATHRHARRINGSVAAATFDRHPLKTLAPRVAPHCLMTLRQRLEELRRRRFRRVVVLKFTRRLASLTAEDFVRRILVGRMGIAALVVGYDFHFGRGGVGDAALLKRLGARFGFAVTVVPPVLDRGEPISSTRVRRLVRLGHVAEAARLLGRPLQITGACVKGLAIGRTLGFPTVNVAPENELLPPHGVYVVRCGTATTSGRRKRPGVANFGVRPTFKPASRTPILEVHLLGAGPRIKRGELVDVELLKFLRPERAFPNLKALKRRIGRDVLAARRYFRRHAVQGSKFKVQS